MIDRIERNRAYASRMLTAIPHSQKLGMTLNDATTMGVVVELPYSEMLVGNPDNGTIHSGALTTLMDTACGLSVVCALDEPEVCPTLDLRIDHLELPRPGKSIYASTEVYRVTRNIIFTRGVAWQKTPEEPIAHAVGTFMRTGRWLGSKGSKEETQS